MLDHWDNLDRSVERGYAGLSLWDWAALPEHISPRYRDYARANASLGINGAALTNVNANARVLTPEYLAKVAALADVFRPYGIRVFLTARFSAPDRDRRARDRRIRSTPPCARGGRQKSDEIYRALPDFGGFLVKANSEGQPGPQDYERTHADGANMLADAVAPHGGIVMWRAFVYSNDVPVDRIRQAYDEFKPLDGAVPRERVRAGEERPARLPAARAVPPAVRRDAEDAAHDGVPDHEGVPRPGHAPRLPRAAVQGGARRRHVRERARARRSRR